MSSMFSCSIFIITESKYSNINEMGTEKEGLHDRYYKNGQIKESVLIKNGMENGYYEMYFENGILKELGYYKNGKKDGFFEQYYEDGKLKDKGIYDNGEIKN